MGNEVSLKHKQQFEEILASYQPSEQTKCDLNQVDLVVLMGISGAGRNTIIEELVQNHDYYFIVSDTTRPPKMRDGKMEIDGVNYNFIDELEFIRGLENGEYLEAEVIHNQQVSGINVEQIQIAKELGKVTVNEIEIGGIKNVTRIKPDTKAIAIFPPSYPVWMKRLMKRETIADSELKNRLNTALRIISEVRKNKDICIVLNDDYRNAAKKIVEIQRGEADAALCRDMAADLFDSFEEEIQQKLETL